jgi:copper chaperone CopZ
MGNFNTKGTAVTTSTYAIKGMTCAHCVHSVRAELDRLPGVTEVGVDLAAGIATVISDEPLPPEAVREAVDEAGYELVS